MVPRKSEADVWRGIFFPPCIDVFSDENDSRPTKPPSVIGPKHAGGEKGKGSNHSPLGRTMIYLIYL